MRPVVIIGAPRSGTNMLRDVLAQLPGWVTWPCDEINAIWRHGNRAVDSDEFGPELARPSVQQYIRGRFAAQARRGRAATVLEKTCANSLRVDFVHRVLPEARFIFIRRHGLDAAASALQRWNARSEVGYLARKARYVPATDVPHYGVQFLRSRWRRAHREASTPTTWGPRFIGMRDLMVGRPLDEVCAIQWRRCVESASTSLSRMPQDIVHEIPYEAFVSEPVRQLEEVLAFLGESEHFDRRMVKNVSARSIGKGRHTLDPDQHERLEALLQPTLRELRYA